MRLNISTMRRKSALLALCFAGTLQTVHAAYPEKPVRWIIPGAAGGAVATPSDLTRWARLLFTGPILDEARRQDLTSLVARALRDKPADIQPLAEARAAFERDYLISLLKLTRGQVSEVARLAGRNRTEFYRLMQRHQLSPLQFKS